MDDNQLIFENLIKVVMTASNARMHSVLQDDEVEFKNEKFPNIMPGEWVSLILLSSNQLRIFFKVFFNLENLKIILDEKQILKTEMIQNDKVLKDFMREYCNLVGSYINATLEKMELPMTMSLPLALKGFDDFFFPYADSVNSYEKNWILRCLGKNFYCSCFVEVFDVKSLDGIKNYIPEIVEIKAGDVDFL